MCGRYVLTMPADEMAAMFDAAPANDLAWEAEWNVCPTMRVPACVAGGGGARRRLRPMRWGLIPHWYKAENDGPLLINARAETVAEKPAFRAACRERRCLIPANGFYEWTKDADGARLPWFFRRANGGPLAFAGIWQDWAPPGGEPFTTCAIVSCAAGPAMREVHHREPVTLAPEDWPLWLGEAGHGAAALMRASPEGRLERFRVGREVNSNRAKGPDLVAPLAA